METNKSHVENLMIAANCNTVYHALAFNTKHHIVAYAAANSVLIMDPYHIKDSIPKVLFSLKGHTDRVNAVSWLTDRILVSISTDKSIIVWAFNQGLDPRDPLSWTFKKVITDAHENIINYFSTYAISDDELYILSMCSGGTLKLWQGQSEETIIHKGDLLFGKNLQETMALQKLGEKHLMLVVGGYDVNIHVYLIPRIQHQAADEKKVFKYKFSLTGHQNALRDLTFSQRIDKDIVYLASASQDHYVRLWKIQPLENISDNMGGHEDVRQYESKTSYVLQDEGETKVYNITLESVMTQHQESVSSVRWGIRKDRDNQDINLQLKDFCLLTASFDFTVCVWKPDLETGIWSVESTLGAMSGNKHAYFDALFLEDDQKILAYTYHGAMHQWNKKTEGDFHQWVPQLTIKGHFGEVVDLDWDQYDACLITTSQDQTTRLFSQYGKDNGWFEFGRPQVHGYDMNSVASVRVNSSVNLPSKILSGGDEKVLRLFEPPFSLVKIINSLHPDADKLQLKFSETRSNEEIEKLITSEAKKQPLGLMNKPMMLANEKMRLVDDEEGGAMGPDFDPNKFLSNVKDKSGEIIEEIKEPPVEDVLMVKTLWPELQKLYGHAYEVFCVAVSYQGDCAASACKAKDKKYADIIIWDLRKGQSTVPSCRLYTHTLTIVQIEFSKCGRYILSGSRDRSWALFKRESLDTLEFKLLKKMKEAHTRIIWGISWSHDDALYVTASREKQKSVKVWHGISDNAETIGTLHSVLPEENPSATAVRFFPSKIKKSQYAMIVGLETGDMLIWSQTGDQQWTKLLIIPEYYTHCDTVRRIKFNARLSNSDTDEYVVATCGNDFSVRLLKLRLD